MTFLFKIGRRSPAHAHTLPANWPSPLHHKCDQPRCKYPNPPQVAEGIYVCRGIIDGFIICDGHFTVSPAQARSSHEQFLRGCKKDIMDRQARHIKQAYANSIKREVVNGKGKLARCL